MKRIILLCAVLLLTGLFVHSDVYIKSILRIPPVKKGDSRKEAVNEISEQWIGNSHFAQITQNSSIIMDLEKKQLIMANHVNHTYVETPLPLDLTKLVPQYIADIMKGLTLKVAVTANKRKKNINNWNCNGYDVVMELEGKVDMKMTMTAWATTEAPFDWRTYKEKVYPALIKATLSQFNLDEEALKKLQQIEGFIIQTETRLQVLGSEAHAEVMVENISQREAPPSIYAVPDGYKKTDKLEMEK